MTSGRIRILHLEILPSATDRASSVSGEVKAPAAGMSWWSILSQASSLFSPKVLTSSAVDAHRLIDQLAARDTRRGHTIPPP